MFKKPIFIFCILLFKATFAQYKAKTNITQQNFTTKGTHWLDLNLGLSFFISNEAALNEFAVITNEKPDYFGFLIQPKYQYFIKNKLSIGPHMGFGHENLFENSLDLDQSNQVYFAGIQTEYYFLKLKNIFYMSTELEASLQYFRMISVDSNVYFKSGLNFIISFLINDDFVVFVKLSDIISYTSSDENFYNLDKGFTINNTFNNFINFPQFGIRYNLF